MKALVLFSGGLDSSTCLALAVHQYGADNVTALFCHYGQKHSKEAESAQTVAFHYGVQLKSLDLSLIFADSDCSLLKRSTQDIPLESYEMQLKSTGGKPVSTYVPFRNGLFLSAAASIALSLGCHKIFYGAHADDAAGNAYPDTSLAFNEAISKSIWIGSGRQLSLEAPFIDKTKAQVVKTGLELKVPFEKTWSCYEGSQKPCCRCGTCIDRIRAFELNGTTDPLLGE